MSENIYPHETGPELIKIPVSNAGVPVTAGISYQVDPVVQGVVVRPGAGAWVTAVIDNDGDPCYSLEGLPVGTYHAWAKVVTASQTVIIDCGRFRLS